MKNLARGVAAQRGVLTAITSGLQFGRLVLSPLSAPPVAARIRTENRQTPTKGKESNMTEATKPSGSFVLWENTLCNPLADPRSMAHSAWHDGYASAKAEPEQEPVAWMESPHGVIRANPLYRIKAPQSVAWSIPLYTAPTPRQWVSLTEQEMYDLFFNDQYGPRLPEYLVNTIKCVEAALKEKNT